MANGTLTGELLRANQRQIDNDRATLARDAKYIADTAARYAESVANGASSAGKAGRIAQYALDLVRLAQRLDTRTEALSYLKAVAEPTN